MSAVSGSFPFCYATTLTFFSDTIGAERQAWEFRACFHCLFVFRQRSISRVREENIGVRIAADLTLLEKNLPVILAP